MKIPTFRAQEKDFGAKIVNVTAKEIVKTQVYVRVYLITSEVYAFRFMVWIVQ